MTLPTLTTNRFSPEPGGHISVQTPDATVDLLLSHVLQKTSLEYGDYRSVSFQSARGVQRFQALGTGRNPATERVVTVDCVDLSFYLPPDDILIARVVEAIYAAHPYEEPVIFVTPCLRARHIRGLDQDNPNRFWNAATADWVPPEHR